MSKIFSNVSKKVKKKTLETEKGKRGKENLTTVFLHEKRNVGSVETIDII